ncbi:MULTISPECIES: ABC transporter ATP-binding protein [Roseobacteraceae]|uniref:Putative D,D-dipeptide transport ATP-binding protein DdpD n=1 Tax=Pseudosulfitobacter pseudonitzschiae TaxID=1402135 RepID=A0A221K677_9RHOB|nr:MULTISPECIES: ABC transporter ATP-binding protein [Roseobacteraceae]ASM74512.1 putative D,D-dipeptide transport ATP-binding protein DdpD [Pseudosulfitobacter pseudonitzschiae]
MLLSVKNLSVGIGNLTLLEGVSFELAKGEILGLVGESGSGKSLTALALTGLLPLIGGRVTAGALEFDGTDIATLPKGKLRALRGRRIAFITQNPMTALDPVQRIGEQVDFVSRTHLGLDRAAARARTVELLTQLRIPQANTICSAYPHQLSGGMKQRIVIAMALAGKPDLIVADEPTTALDVTVQAQIIHLLTRLVRARGLALVLITHDMGVVAQACDKVAVLYAGRLAEQKPVNALFANPQHPYSAALIDCIPRDGMAPGTLTGIPGNVASATAYPTGCRFHPRCPNAGVGCDTKVPTQRTLSNEGTVACHYPLNGAPDV